MSLSLLMALLDPQPDDAKSATGSDLKADYEGWAGASKERRELMLQALYAALPYALTNERAANVVGRLLAMAIRGDTEISLQAQDDIKVLRKELREELREHFDKLYAKIPEAPPLSSQS